MLKKIAKKLWRTGKSFVLGIFWYSGDLLKYRQLLQNAGLKANLKFFPQVFDKDPASHTFDKHYVYMDRWAFKQLISRRPEEHVDVGSSIRFLSTASAITKLKFVDIRPVQLDFDNFECLEGSILNMPFADNSVNSLSCLHVAEHIGLGRYGDPLDPQGTVKACKELARVLKPGGFLYFALPIGKTATYFNAHRIFEPQIILEYFKGLELIGFSAVGDSGHFIENGQIQDFKNSNYACGMFCFIKPN
jgi:SAM-dependent methyltransferase